MLKPVTIGDATLYLGDCAEVLPLLGEIDAVVTDPPYGVGLKKRVRKHTSKSASVLYKDDREFIQNEIIPRIRVAIEKAPCTILICGIRCLFDYPEPTDLGCVFHSAGAGRSRWGFNGFNPILYYGKDPYLVANLGSRPNSVYASWISEDVDHPAPKPIKWMEWMVLRASPFENQVILDPFMGSGTTGVACANLSRKFIGIEIEPKYFDIACKRIEKAYSTGDLLKGRPALKTSKFF